MDQGSRSFIPKKTIQRAKRVRSKKRVYVFTYVTFAVVAATIAASAAIFIYIYLLEQQLSDKTLALQSLEDTITKAEVEELQEFQAELELIEGLFAQHYSPLLVLESVERSTANDVTFSSFSYARSEDGVEVTLEGGTDQFDSLSFQYGLYRGKDDRGELRNNILVLASTTIDGTAKSEELEEAQEPAGAGGSELEDDGYALEADINFSVVVEVDPSLILFDPQKYTDNATAVSASLQPTSFDGFDGTEAAIDDGAQSSEENEVSLFNDDDI